jgi:hypothetical protein
MRNCGKEEGGDGVGESLLRALRRSIALLEVEGSSGFRVSLSLNADGMKGMQQELHKPANALAVVENATLE